MQKVLPLALALATGISAWSHPEYPLAPAKAVEACAPADVVDRGLGRLRDLIGMDARELYTGDRSEAYAFNGERTMDGYLRFDRGRLADAYVRLDDGVVRFRPIDGVYHVGRGFADRWVDQGYKQVGTTRWVPLCKEQLDRLEEVVRSFE